jgi:hypothetical protein
VNLSNIFRINRGIIIAVFVLQFFLCTGEGLMIIDSYIGHRESWPWFFTFTANLPASALMAMLMTFLFNQFKITSFYGQTALSYFLFLVGGTLWWGLLLHITTGIYNGIKDHFKTNNSNNKTTKPNEQI